MTPVRRRRMGPSGSVKPGGWHRGFAVASACSRSILSLTSAIVRSRIDAVSRPIASIACIVWLGARRLVLQHSPLGVAEPCPCFTEIKGAKTAWPAWVPADGVCVGALGSPDRECDVQRADRRTIFRGLPYVPFVRFPTVPRRRSPKAVLKSNPKTPYYLSRC